MSLKRSISFGNFGNFDNSGDKVGTYGTRGVLWMLPYVVSMGVREWAHQLDSGSLKKGTRVVLGTKPCGLPGQTSFDRFP